MGFVQFTEPQFVTNAACCSSPKVMCAKCAAASLARNQGMTVNQPPLGLPQTSFGTTVNAATDYRVGDPWAGRTFSGTKK